MYYTGTVVNVAPDNHDNMYSVTVRVDNLHDDYDDDSLPTAHYLPTRSSFSTGGLRKGTRVLVEFEDGNPLAPVIQGVVPDKDTINKMYDITKHYPEPYAFSDGNMLAVYEPNDSDPSNSRFYHKLGNSEVTVTPNSAIVKVGSSTLTISDSGIDIKTQNFTVDCTSYNVKSSGLVSIVGNGIKLMGGSLIRLIASKVAEN